jgi:hypothetical protein
LVGWLKFGGVAGGWLKFGGATGGWLKFGGATGGWLKFGGVAGGWLKFGGVAGGLLKLGADLRFELGGGPRSWPKALKNSWISVSWININPPQRKYLMPRAKKNTCFLEGNCFGDFLQRIYCWKFLNCFWKHQLLLKLPGDYKSSSLKKHF